MPDRADSTPDYLRLVVPGEEPGEYTSADRPAPEGPAEYVTIPGGVTPPVAAEPLPVDIAGPYGDGVAGSVGDALPVPVGGPLPVPVGADPLTLTAPGTPPTPGDHLVRIGRRWLAEARAEASARWDRKGSVYADPPETLKAFTGYHLAAPWVPDDGQPHTFARLEGQAVGFGILLPLFLLFSGARWCAGRQLRAVVPIAVLLIILAAAGVL
jgi:hypothetical protein